MSAGEPAVMVAAHTRLHGFVRLSLSVCETTKRGSEICDTLKPPA